mgnify:CR=1 FL=1|jgi:uncharacterized protein (TIGR02466 family)
MTDVIYSLFSTPVYCSKIELSDKENNFITNQKFERTTVDNGNRSKNTYILNLKQLKKLKQKIEDKIEIYVREHLKINKKCKFYITNSWIMEHEKNDYAQSHIHSNSILSGVLYVKTPLNSGNLNFHSDKHNYSFLGATLKLEYDSYNILNCNQWTIAVEEGLIVLFPSNTYHSTEKCCNDEKRYCLAFNIFVKGELGSKEDTVKL